LDKAANVHVPIGKASFDEEKLLANYTTLIETLIKAKPAAAKGQYMKNVVVATTMGPGIRINPQKPLGK
ncbi:MAG: 50S ribosomal protein L1, partial [Bacillota bacterium]|nr:50S ribosomal protein L1 [Bacillota bacterium]